MSIASVFSENLKRIRDDRDLTQFELAEDADISLASIQGYESGRKWPRLDAIARLAKSLEVPEEHFFNCRETPKIPQPIPSAQLEAIKEAIRAAAPSPSESLSPTVQEAVRLLKKMGDPAAAVVLKLLAGLSVHVDSSKRPRGAKALHSSKSKKPLKN